MFRAAGQAGYLPGWLQGQKLTEVINTQHGTPESSPGISLGPNTIADPDLESTVSHLGVSSESAVSQQ